MAKQLNKLSATLVAVYDKTTSLNNDRTISVNPVVAELATWYEKFRTAIDYREDEVILRSTIERILKRRFLMGGDGNTIAAPLIRELVWARYFPDSSVPESQVIKVAQTIDLHLLLEKKINEKHRINHSQVYEWIIHLLSSEIEDILKPGNEKDLMSNFIYQLFKSRIDITDDSEETRDIQVFIAVRRAYANDDLALIRYRLFKQYFGKVTEDNLKKIAHNFLVAKNKFEEQFSYPLKDKIYTYIKNQTIPFLILEDVFKKHKGRVSQLISDEDMLGSEVLAACNSRYKTITGKVRRAIIRSVIFIFFTKAMFALFIEGTSERLLYGHTVWSSMILNTLTPPVLMIIVGFLIQTPNRENSFRILRKINTILYDESPSLDLLLSIKKKSGKTNPLIWSLFILLWLTTFGLSLGVVVFVLSKLGVNPLSQTVFIFFLAIVSFVSYRINRTAHMYILKDRKESLGSLLFAFFFMPFIQVGKRLTMAISQINIILFIFDFIIETPFKGIFAFFEQWFLFLRTQREKLD